MLNILFGNRQQSVVGVDPHMELTLTQDVESTFDTEVSHSVCISQNLENGRN